MILRQHTLSLIWKDTFSESTLSSSLAHHLLTHLLEMSEGPIKELYRTDWSCILSKIQSV